MAINATSLFSLLEKEMGKDAVAHAMLSYLSASQKTVERPSFLEPAPSSPKAAAKKPAEAPGAPKKAKKVSSAEPPSAAPAKAEEKAKAEDKPKRALGDGQKAWNAFILKVAGEKGSDTEDYSAWLKKHEGEGLKGNLKMVFAKELRKLNESAYEAFASGFKSSAGSGAASVLSEDSLEEKPVKVKKEKKAKKPAAVGAGESASSSSESEAGAPKKVRKPWSEAAKAAQSARARARVAAKKVETAASVPLPASQDGGGAGDSESDFEPWTHGGKSLFKNVRGDVLTEDMEWVGHFDEKTETLDTSAPKPLYLDI